MRTRPDRIRVRLSDEVPASSTILDLPQRRLWPAGLIVGVMFAIFAGVAWSVAGNLTRHAVRDVFDLMTFLFQGFWLLGWSVAVVGLGALTILLFLYSESARLQEGRLLYVPALGPFKIIIDYDLSRVRNVRVEAAKSAGQATIRFDYDLGTNSLGDAMPTADAERLAETIRGAAAAAGSSPIGPRTVSPPEMPPPVVASPPDSRGSPDPSPMSLSGLALIAANLVPLAGVLFFHWDLPTIVVLFWAESAVIGFYTVLKLAIVGRLPAIFAIPFFVGHYGGFMAMHFLFIYLMFVRGLNPVGLEPGAREALLKIFLPIWPTLAVLFLSHGVSFVQNFLGRREYQGATVSRLMAAPYNRIVVMHLTVIFGGWIVLLLKSPVAALVLLIVLKTAMDFTAHRREHAGGTSFA